MSHLDIIRAWKDEEYRLSLSEAERALLPENPAGAIELADGQLDAAAGGVTLVRQGCPVPSLDGTCGRCSGNWHCGSFIVYSCQEPICG